MESPFSWDLVPFSVQDGRQVGPENGAVFRRRGMGGSQRIYWDDNLCLDINIYNYIILYILVGGFKHFFNMFFMFHNNYMGCHPKPIDFHIFQKGVKTTNQVYIYIYKNQLDLRMNMNDTFLMTRNPMAIYSRLHIYWDMFFWDVDGNHGSLGRWNRTKKNDLVNIMNHQESGDEK